MMRAADGQAASHNASAAEGLDRLASGGYYDLY
jgi:hypothetical protein